ncbi:MAG TPA: hypothetical protein VKA15_22620, partial [Isosphaeraceae bacterium]|nr:hypothetical protein [Isosphaeraceae bacterium]
MTTKYYLRVEAVNLPSFIYDTQDLSTIRGASLTLIQIVEELKDLGQSQGLPGDFRAISTGASSGLFEFTAATKEEACEVARIVEAYLGEDPCAKHATFVVDVVETEPAERFRVARERVLAANRWRQMSQPSLVIPAWNRGREIKDREGQFVTACEVDRVRAGTAKDMFPEEREGWVSPSVKARRQAGQIARQSRIEHTGAGGPGPSKPVDATTGFYLREIGLDELFTQDFGTLSNAEGRDLIRDLDSKIAVIYIDGNGFGSRQERMERPEELTGWDNDIKSKRKAVLRSLLAKAEDNEDRTWRIDDPQRGGNRIRFETLIWGGDDLMWVVPAWKGWETLEHFFSSAEWMYTAEDGSPRPLTHAAGVVFCHHNAPIHRITRLAQDLVEDHVKRKSRTQNMFAYAVLESFDHITEGMEKYWNKRLPKHLASARAEQRAVARQGWILPGDKISAIREVV